MAQAAAKVGDASPAAAVCCNACRTCATTNIIALGIAGVTAVGAGAASFARRLVGRTATSSP
jgi:hypothetical protein